MIVHPTPNPQEVPLTILQHSYTKGTPAPYPQPTGSTTHHLTTLIQPQSNNTRTLKGPTTPNPQEVPPTILQHSYTKGTPLPPTHRKYHPPSYNTHTATILQHAYTKVTPCPHPQTHRKYHPPSYKTHTSTILQHSYTKGTPHPPTPNPQEVQPTILQHSYTKGTPCLPPPNPQPTGSTAHHLTTLIHPPSYNTHTLKGPPASHPLPPTHRKYHPPSYNTHTLKGPPAPHPYPQLTGSTTHHLTTLKHPQSYNTHTLKGPPYPQPTGSTTHHLTTLIH